MRGVWRANLCSRKWRQWWPLAARAFTAGSVAYSNSGRPALAESPASPAGSTRGSRPRPTVVTHNAEYIQGVQIYGVGIKEDPVPGEKRGRGKQYLTSSYFLYDMGVFIERNFDQMAGLARYAYKRSKDIPGFDFRYFTNVSNALFLKAEAEGLRTEDGRDFFLMAAWLAMAAAEVDSFPYAKYSQEERAKHREAFYAQYIRQPDDPDHVVWVPGELDDQDLEARLGKYCIEGCRIDMIPAYALERLGIHNELCAIKFQDPTDWMVNGFKVSTRISSMKRHFESVHARDTSEDHLAHLIWGFMAVTHVVAVLPEFNDLVDFESIRRENVRLCDHHLQHLVGDGGFRSRGRHQSAREPREPVQTSSLAKLSARE